ncbi:Hypothetical protein, putative [Bodo saltans]|uniref:Uncharacterized protein n=1 Tax=Bodo saltans TaxID=75058 RepID=A0A0S4IHE7_BODSA|nr:Hypothetical protein, putative [Bodo saltans]|eukprot:CUE64528.1 Hypothetical protein, putative [Bodo saltans]
MTTGDHNNSRRRQVASATSISAASASRKRRSFAERSVAGDTVATSSAVSTSLAAFNKSSSRSIGNSSLPPSYSAAGATKARDDAYKLLQQNISFLSTRKQELQRHLALCLREHRTLTAAVRGAQERQRELHDAKASLHSQLLQMSMITSAMASVGRGTSFRGSPPLTPHRPCSNDLHFLSTHRNLSITINRSSGSNICRIMALLLRLPALTKILLMTIQKSLSQKESSAVFEHSARLEALEDELRRGVQGSVSTHHDLVSIERKAQHMVTLLDRAADAEVQVLQGAFPDYSSSSVTRSTSTTHNFNKPRATHSNDQQHQHAAANNDQQQQQRLNVVFVNASPMFPDMTIDDCADLLLQMSALCVTASEVSLRLRRTIENGHVSAALTSQSLALQLSRGEKIAEAKHDEAELLHQAALNEEVRLKSKKSDLLQQLQGIQHRQEHIQHTLKLRVTLGVTNATTARGTSSGSVVTNGSHTTRPLRGRSKSPSSQQLDKGFPSREVQVTVVPTTDKGFRVPAGTVEQQNAANSRRGVSTNFLIAANTEPFPHDVVQGGDAVVALLSQERGMLELQAAEIIAKIAHLDVTLKRVLLEKQHHRLDAEASTVRSAACVSLSPARSPSAVRSPEVLSPTTRTPPVA